MKAAELNLYTTVFISVCTCCLLSKFQDNSDWSETGTGWLLSFLPFLQYNKEAKVLSLVDVQVSHNCPRGLN